MFVICVYVLIVLFVGKTQEFSFSDFVAFIIYFSDSRLRFYYGILLQELMF